MLTAGVMAEIESLLVAGVSLAEVAQKLGLKLNTLQRRCRRAGCATPPKKDCEPIAASTKSQRSEIDCAAPMGRGATATKSWNGWQPASGQLEEVELSFNRAVDLPHGGVLLALPALLVSGLLSPRANTSYRPASMV